MEVKDRRQSEIQSLVTSAVVIDFIDEIQRVEVISNIGEVFQIEFRGQKTCVTSASYYWSSHCFVKGPSVITQDVVSSTPIIWHVIFH